MVCAQIEFGAADRSFRQVATVGAGANGEITGQRGARQHYHRRCQYRGCTNNLAILPIADIYRAGPDRLLVAVSSSISATAPGPSTGPRGWPLRPRGRCATASARVRLGVTSPDPKRRPPPRAASCRVAIRHPPPNGSENRTSPSTMSRMSGMPLRNWGAFQPHRTKPGRDRINADDRNAFRMPFAPPHSRRRRANLVGKPHRPRRTVR